MNPHYSPRSAWTWRPAELAALVVGFIAWWPLGVAVLAWKFWNDRSARPKDFEQALRDGFLHLRAAAGRMFSGSGTIPEDELAPTGNAAFDQHVRETLARIDADRRALAEEIRAFRAFLAEEQSGQNEIYERFKTNRRRA
jgi:hypothetical protein